VHPPELVDLIEAVAEVVHELPDGDFRNGSVRSRRACEVPSGESPLMKPGRGSACKRNHQARWEPQPLETFVRHAANVGRDLESTRDVAAGGDRFVNGRVAGAAKWPIGFQD
jgi:hypothetical protein